VEPVRSIEINLLKVDRAEKQKQVAIAAVLLAVVALSGIMGGMYAVALKNLTAGKRVNQELKSDLAKYRRLEVSARSQNQARQRIQERMRQIEELDKNRVSYIALLEELQLVVPAQANFTQLNIDKDKLSISGNAADKQEVARLLAGLRTSARINNISSVTASGGTEADSQVTFNIQAEWGAKP